MVILNQIPFAFGFTNLAALGWLAAAAAPILIHLWMRQTRRETTWAAIRFLQAALERQARKLRLQHWILLAVRTALLILVALAAAKPFFDSGPLASSSAPTHWVMVIDASLSMNYLHESSTRLQVAKRHAASLVNGSGATDRFTLCVMADQTETPIGRSVADSAAVLRAIERIESTHASSDLTSALAIVDRVLESSAEGPHAGLRTEVVFFTDLGANSWSAATGEGAAESLLSGLKAAAGASVVDVGAPSPSNVSVSRVELANTLPTTGVPLEVRGEVTLHSMGVEQETEVELYVDGIQVASHGVKLASGSPAPIDFVHELSDAGSHTVSLRVAADKLPADDSGWLALELSPRIRILCVEGARGSARYVTDALNPHAVDDSPIEPVVISDADLTTIELEDFSCVVFCNVMGFGPGEAQRVRKYVEQGGGAVFFLGDRTAPESYNDLFRHPVDDRLGRHAVSDSPFRFVVQSGEAGENNASAFAPIQVGPHEARESYGIDPLDYAHPIVAPFQGRERAGLLTTPVSRSHALALTSDDPLTAQIVLALEGGLPLVVSAQQGLGRLVVVATDASLDSIDPTTGQPWTAMPAWPSFLPLVRGMVEHVGAGGAPQRLSVGEPFRGRAPNKAWGEGTIEIERPDGESEMTRIDQNGEWTYSRTNKIGVYRAVQENGVVLASAAANSDAAESSLKRVSLELLPDWLNVREGAAAPSSQESGNASASIHRLLIQLALLLALIDTALASWFGRGHA